jgi:hypothetical protein
MLQKKDAGREMAYGMSKTGCRIGKSSPGWALGVFFFGDGKNKHHLFGGEAKSS